MDTTPVPHDLIVVGAGFTGMHAVIHAARQGLDVLGLETGADVGGTWYWNRYPGSRCDVESIDYSYSFDEELEREWRWTERYATQPEILRYLEHVADRFDVRRHYRFEQEVAAADWDEGTQRWTVRTTSGLVAAARWLLMASGSLSRPLAPTIPGRADFAGEVYFTAAWPKEPVDLNGKRVGLIGTGSSGIQSAPIIAAAAKELVVYQRTANYSVPALNRPIGDEEWAREQQQLPERRRLSWHGLAGSPWTAHPVPFETLRPAERDAVFEESWERGGVLFAKAFMRQTVDPAINEAARRFFERKLAQAVRDPQTLADLTPDDHPIGTKRICTDSGYYAMFNEPHVSLVNLKRDPIVEITPGGIRTRSGERELDVLVFATGFDALTGALTAMEIRGRQGVLLRDAWATRVTTYLGIAVPGFPNLLTLNGAGTPSVLTNMALGGEQQSDYALRLIAHCARQGFTSAEASADAAEAWTTHVAEVAAGTLFATTRSWYTGSNVEGKPADFLPYLGGFRPYIDKLEQIAAEGYPGFVLGSVAGSS